MDKQPCPSSVYLVYALPRQQGERIVWSHTEGCSGFVQWNVYYV